LYSLASLAVMAMIVWYHAREGVRGHWLRRSRSASCSAGR
jgi:hypothetical protein